MGVARGTPRFQNVSKMRKKYPFWAVWVPRMSMEGAICIGIALDDEPKPSITDFWGFQPTNGLKNLFVGPKLLLNQP